VSSPQPWGRAGLVLACVLLVDQVTKRLVQSGIDEGEHDGVLPGVELVHVRNHGVAFGALAGGGTIVAVVIGVALVALVIWFMRHADKPLAWLPTGLLLGGAVGNIFDRIRDGAVTDFIKLPAWPAFNVADIAITFGVLSLLYVLESGGDGDGAESKPG
jgi:signal peptidase II